MVAPVARASGELSTRVVVGAGLIIIAVAAVWAGGVAFTALVAATVLLMSAEWSVMHGVARAFRLASLVALAFVTGVTVYVSAVDAAVALAASTGAIGLFMCRVDRNQAFWVAAGLLYCGLPMIALLWLRGLPTTGLSLTTAIFAIVWATDIAAFFIGRAVGGVRFAPLISPNKTWAGVAGGVTSAAASAALAMLFLLTKNRPDESRLMSGGVAPLLQATAIGALFGMVAIIGDLFESWLKRRAGVKDSGNLLPGHGGVMDRIDGLVPVAVLAALLVVANGTAL